MRNKIEQVLTVLKYNFVKYTAHCSVKVAVNNILLHVFKTKQRIFDK